VGDALAEVQRRFYALVTAPEGVARGLESGLAQADLEQMVRGDARLSSVERLDIYADMYFYRIRDVLREDYPKLVATVGDDEFHNLVTDYLIACPPRHFSLRNAGDRLPAFVSRHRLSATRPWLRDLAALERQRLEVFDAADAAPLTLSQLRRVAPEDFGALPLRLVPAHSWVVADFPVEEAWRAIDVQGAAQAPPSLERRPTQLLVWRQDTLVFHRHVEDLERRLLPPSGESVALGSICERFATLRPNEDPAALFVLLGQWVTDGLVRQASTLRASAPSGR
jgi:hypothetical protein